MYILIGLILGLLIKFSASFVFKHAANIRNILGYIASGIFGLAIGIGAVELLDLIFPSSIVLIVFIFLLFILFKPKQVTEA